MKITKYEHACLVLEQDGEVLVVDPGLLAGLPELSGVTTIVLTHNHPDHLYVEHLAAICAANPTLTIYAPDDAIDQLQELEAKLVVIKNEVMTNGAFQLEFFGQRTRG